MAKVRAAAPTGLPLKMALLVIGVIALGFNLRGAITSLPPVYPELQSKLGLSTATVSLLAATPVICFGVVSAFAAWLSRQLGEERILLIAALLLTFGLLLRGLFPDAMLFPGTILASSAIAVMNVLLSSLIKRRWPERAGLLIGIYLTALSAGAVTGSLLSVPLYNASGGSVRVTLGWLAGPAALAVLLWLPQARYRTQEGPSRRVAVWRHALAWQVTAFMGLQSLLYYAALSWLPTIFRDRGATPGEAGNLLALMGLGNFATSLLVPVLAHRLHGQRVLAVPAVCGLAVGIAGSLYAPLGTAAVWVLILGVSQGAALALAIFFTMARAPDPVTAASLSSLAQAVGYLVASAGPLELGLLHSATGSWNLPVAVLLILAGFEVIAGLLAGRPRMLPAAPGPADIVTPEQGPPVSQLELGDRRTLGNRGRDAVRQVPGMHKQRPGQFADAQPQRGQHLLAVAPGGDLVGAEARPDRATEVPRVAPVVPPGRQPGTQVVVALQHRPVPQPLGDLARGGDHERQVAASLDAMYPALVVAASPDARGTEPRPDRQRGHGMAGLVPGRPHGGLPRRGEPLGQAAVVALPDPRVVHDGFVVVPG